MQSFREALNEVRPRTPLRLFDVARVPVTVIMMSDAIKTEFIRPIREALAEPFYWNRADDPQQPLFEP